MIGIVLAGLLGAAPAWAQVASSQDVSSSGMFRVQAFTVRTWWGSWLAVTSIVYDLPYGCSRPNCRHVTDTGNASNTSWATGCGTWVGRSAHGYANDRYGGGGVTIQEPRWTNLYAGSCGGGGGELDCGGVPCVEDDPNTPIVINLGLDEKYTFTSAAEGVLFDIDADGDLDQIAWTEAGSDTAFLALDRNGNGTIDDGRELFGGKTVAGAPNGFDALVQLSVEAGGSVEPFIDATTSPLFGRLLLWTDRNHNGLSEPSELQPASDILTAIAGAYQPHNRRDGHGNRFAFRGWVYTKGLHPRQDPEGAKARKRFIYDVLLVVQQ